ncbi:MAG: VWA domain-containing protein [Acidobacteriota bacterium]
MLRSTVDRALVAALSAAILALGFVAFSGGQQPPFSISVQAEYIKVPLTVLDAQGKIIADVRRQDLEVFENGIRQEIANFVVDKDPIDVILLVDISSSLRREIKDLKKVAGKFAEAFDDEDRLCVIGFSADSELVLDWTSKKGRVKKAVNSLELGHRTAMYDALFVSCREQFQPSKRKRAIILLTDGLDNESRLGFEDALTAVVEANAATYVVSKTRIAQQGIERSHRIAFLTGVIRSQTGEEADFVKELFDKKESELEKLANSTGGRVFYPLQSSDLKGAYEQVAFELQNQFLLTYRPTSAEPGFRAIQVRYKGSPGRVVHRKGYYSGPSPIGTLRRPAVRLKK